MLADSLSFSNYVTGRAELVDDPQTRKRAFADAEHVASEDEILFELKIEMVMHTTWEGWGTRDLHPVHKKWRAKRLDSPGKHALSPSRSSKRDRYRFTLQRRTDWDRFLIAESGLPGPRANLELAHTVADLGDVALFHQYLAFSPARAPTNSPQEFLALCGILGMGRLLAEGRTTVVPILRRYAADPRWRVREGVAMALQRLGERDMLALLRLARTWSHGTLLEQRAAAAAIAEPKLLHSKVDAKRALQILDTITAALARLRDRNGDDVQALRKALGYCWSVCVVATPVEGVRMMERWLVRDDPDVRWIMRENLSKKRLISMDPAWVKRWQQALAKRVGAASARR